MTIEPHKAFGFPAKILTAAFALGLMTAAATAEDAPQKIPSGTIRLQSVQAGYIGMASAGEGVLRFGGRSYKFKVGGLGAGGIGFSEMKAHGNVYNLHSMSEFEGAYGQARMGWAIGQHGRGKLWLQNTNGVVLELNARRKGLALTTGLDGMIFTLAK